MATKLQKEEQWKIQSDLSILHTPTPLDICYVLFNCVHLIKEITNKTFKENFLTKFENIIFEGIFLESSLLTLHYIRYHKLYDHGSRRFDST